mgnify:CR=1 FL=1
MSGKKWQLVTPSYSLPQIWTEDREQCVTDRVFCGFGPLIAAAPELLSSLIDMVDMFERHISGKIGPENAAERWDNARDAIAKATGIPPAGRHDSEYGHVSIHARL